MYAVAAGRNYGVAFASGANLHDPQKRAKPETVYFFGRADTTACIVWSAPESKLAKFRTDAPGLPPDTP
ncbi:hypothetical protein CCP1ISM_2900001 [Azospirillaceae bacterium]